jgi:hypothetical protein
MKSHHSKEINMASPLSILKAFMKSKEKDNNSKIELDTFTPKPEKTSSTENRRDREVEDLATDEAMAEQSFTPSDEPPVPDPMQDVLNAVTAPQESDALIKEEDMIKFTQAWADRSDISSMIMTQQTISAIDYLLSSLPEEARSEVNSYATSILTPLFKAFRVVAELDREITGSAIGISKIEELASVAKSDRAVKDGTRVLYEAAFQASSNAKVPMDIAIGVSTATHAASPAMMIAVGALAPASAIGLAAGAWGAMGISTYYTMNAGRYYFSLPAWFKNNVKQYEKAERKIGKLDKHITQLHQKNTSNTEEEKIKNNKKIAQLQAKINGLEQHQDNLKDMALLIAKMKHHQVEKKVEKKFGSRENLPETMRNKFNEEVEKRDLSGEWKNRFADSISQIEENREKRRLRDDPLYKPEKRDSPEEKRKAIKNEINTVKPHEAMLFDLLRKNKRDAFYNKFANTIGIGAVATGLSLVAASPFSHYGAPVLLFFGIALISIGILGMTAKNVAVYINNKIASAVNTKAIRKELEKEYQEKVFSKDDYQQKVYNKLLEKPGDLLVEKQDEFTKKRLQFRLAFEHTYGDKLKNMNPEEKVALELTYYRSLFAMHPKNRATILKAAERKAFSDQTFVNAINRQLPQDATHLERGDTSLEFLGKDDKSKILNRENRHVYRETLTHPISKLFKNVREKIRSGGQKLKNQFAIAPRL